MFNVSEIQSIIELIAQTVAISGTVALAALGGYALFKLMTLASLLWFAKFVVQRTYELVKMTLDRPKTYEIILKGRSIVRSGNKNQLESLGAEIEKALARNSFGYSVGAEVTDLADYISKYKQ